MTQDKATTLLRRVLDIHFGRDDVRNLLSKKENDSYSVLMADIDKFLNGKEEDNGLDKRDIYST